MAKSGDLQKEPVPEVPVSLYVHQEFDEFDLPVLRVDNPDAYNIETMGITPTFEVDKLPIMVARALAHGVTLERRD